jgi:hypothetical protein
MQKIPVGRAALLARINRRLQKDGQRVYRSRSAAEKVAMGDWYMTGPKGIARRRVDLVALAREMGCLEPWEALK